MRGEFNTIALLARDRDKIAYLYLNENELRAASLQASLSRHDRRHGRARRADPRGGRRGHSRLSLGEFLVSLMAQDRTFRDYVQLYRSSFSQSTHSIPSATACADATASAYS